MDLAETIQSTLHLGTWLGRRQAFSLIAGKCSAADVECLRALREEKEYRYLRMNWEKFCRKHLGISRAAADRLIRQLEEFGPTFFELGLVTRITPEDYRLIAGAITEDGLSYNGETIPITERNGPRLAEAVDALCRQAAPEAQPECEAARALAKARNSLQATVRAYERLRAISLDEAGRSQFLAALQTARQTLDRLALTA
jgi:hypothetical protein